MYEIFRLMIKLEVGDMLFKQFCCFFIGCAVWKTALPLTVMVGMRKLRRSRSFRTTPWVSEVRASLETLAFLGRLNLVRTGRHRADRPNPRSLRGAAAT